MNDFDVIREALEDVGGEIARSADAAVSRVEQELADAKRERDAALGYVEEQDRHALTLEARVKELEVTLEPPDVAVQ